MNGDLGSASQRICFPYSQITVESAALGVDKKRQEQLTEDPSMHLLERGSPSIAMSQLDGVFNWLELRRNNCHR